MAKKPEPGPSADAELSQLSLLDQESVEESPPEPVDEVPEVVEAPPEPRPTSLASAFRSHGYEVGEDASDEEVLSHLEELEAASERAQKLEREAAQYRQQALQYQKMLEEKETKSAPAPEEKPAAKPKLEVPEWSDMWESFLTTDDRNNIVIREEYRGSVDPSLPEKYIKRKSWERERLQQLLQQEHEAPNIDERLQEIKKTVAEELREEFKREQQQLQVKSKLDQFASEHEAWLFENGVGSNFTDAGELLNEHLSYALERGFEPDKALAYAKSVVQEQTGETPWVESAPEEPATPKKKKVAFRNRLKGNNGRIKQSPVERPAASPEARAKGQNIDQQLSGLFQGLMSEGVAERI